MVKNNAGILFGLCFALAACDGSDRDLTSPGADPGALDPQSASLLSAGNTWATRRSGLPPAFQKNLCKETNVRVRLQSMTPASG